MAVIGGIFLLLLVDWTLGQVTDLPPAIDLLNTANAAAETVFERRNGENVATNIGTGTNNQGTAETFVGVNTNVGGNPDTLIRTNIVDPNTGAATILTGTSRGATSSVDVNARATIQGNPDSGAPSIQGNTVDGGRVLSVEGNAGTGVSSVQGNIVRTNINTRVDPLGTAGSSRTNTAVRETVVVNQGGTLGGNVGDSNLGTSVRVSESTRNVGLNTNQGTGTSGAAGSENIIVSTTNNRINTGTFGGNTGINTQGNNLNTARTTVINAGGSIGGNTAGRTTVTNTGGTTGGNRAGVNRRRNNVNTATSGGTVRVGNKEGLSASAQNRRPRLPDISHGECVQFCKNSQYKSSRHCLFASNNDCQKFVICYKHGGTWFGYSYFCPFGKYWYGHACVGFADYQCAYDRCKLDSSLRSYRDKSLQYVDPDLNCRTYWQCQNGKSFPYCCPSGQAYREGLGCVDDINCRDWCCPRNQIFVEGIGCREMPHEICFEKCCPADVDYGSCVADQICLDDCVRDLHYQVKNCPLRPVPGDPTKYSIHDNGQMYHMPCGHGTVYMHDKCSCVPGTGGSPSAMTCNSTVHLDFNNDTVKNSKTAVVETVNVTSLNNFGRFGRGSRAHVEFYRSNGGVLFNIFIELRFFDSNRYKNGRLLGPDAQVLVSNCRIRDGDELSPSIAIVLLPATQTLTFVGITETESASFNIPYERKGWNNVLLRYDGSELYGEVTYQETSGAKKLRTNRDSRPLGGKLITSNVNGLSIGSCSNTDYFEGYIDEIWIFDCIPQTQQFPSANVV